MKIHKIQILKNKDRKWYWRIRWSNGRIASSAESYNQKGGAYKSANKLFTALTGYSAKKIDKGLDSNKETWKFMETKKNVN